MLDLISFGQSGYGDLLLLGLWVTMQVSLLSFAFSVLFGLALGFLATMPWSISRLSWRVYYSVLTGVPPLLVIYFVFYNLPQLLSVSLGVRYRIDPLTAGCFALTLVYAAYIGEITRGAVLNVPTGQFDAGKSLGLSTAKLWRLVIIPQLWRLMFPGLANIWLVVLQTSALVSLVGLHDLVYVSRKAADVTGAHYLFYTVAAAAFIIIAVLSEIGGKRIQRSILVSHG
jgi:His/Glu/Gln/Arg/opine family amino acid ABC transporter permease subunit